MFSHPLLKHVKPTKPRSVSEIQAELGFTKAVPHKPIWILTDKGDLSISHEFDAKKTCSACYAGWTNDYLLSGKITVFLNAEREDFSALQRECIEIYVAKKIMDRMPSGTVVQEILFINTREDDDDGLTPFLDNEN